MVEVKEKRNYVWRELSLVFRVGMGLVGSSWSKSDPVVIYKIT